MHPIIIIASDKDPAIGAAVDVLQEAGFEVRVLNTATAKLVDFLGALAGVDDESTEDESEDKPETEPVQEPEAKKPEAEEPVDKNDPLDPSKMEAYVSGERVIVEITEGSEVVLHPDSVVIAAKTVYSLNESQFAFWPSIIENEFSPIFEGVELQLNGHHTWKVIQISEDVATPPILKIGREFLNQLI